MSSLYNAMFGVNPQADLLLKMLHLDGDKKSCTGRFRDIFLNADGTKIILYTRNGGGNREEYQWVFDDFKKLHPYYIRDWDDDFDNTFAYIEFNVPPEYLKETKALATGKEPLSISDKFKQFDEDMKNGVDNEVTQRAMKVGEQIFKQMEGAMKTGEKIKVIEVDQSMGEPDGEN